MAGAGLWGVGAGEKDHLKMVEFEGPRGHPWRRCLQQLNCLLRTGNPEAGVPWGVPLPRPNRTPNPTFRLCLSLSDSSTSVSPKQLCLFFNTDSIASPSLHVLCICLYIFPIHNDYSHLACRSHDNSCCVLWTLEEPSQCRRWGAGVRGWRSGCKSWLCQYQLYDLKQVTIFLSISSFICKLRAMIHILTNSQGSYGAHVI